KLSQGQVIYTIDEGPRVQIRKVSFSGNDAMKTGTLRKVIKTKQKKWFYWPFYYTKETVTEDIERVENLYYERGFLDYRIAAKTEFTDDKRKVHVTFVIDEGPIYRVGKIVFAGNHYFDQQTLQAKLQLEPGQVYIKRKAESDAKRLGELYHEHGFVDAEVAQQPKFVSDANMVNVEFEIAEGKQFRIGRIDITGNEFTQDKAIRQVLNEYGFTPGQLYNASMAPKQGGGKLEEYVQRRVLAEQVIIRPAEPASGAADQKDVKVDIKEGLTGMITPGVGVSSDVGFSGHLIYRQLNFDIMDWPESFGEFITMQAFKGAGQSLEISLAPGTEVSMYTVDFSDPYWRDRPTRLDVSGSKLTWFRRSHDEDRLRSYLGFEQRREQHWRRSLSFRAENVDVGSIDFDAPQEIRSVKGNNSLMGIRLGMGRDLTDDVIRPTKGYTFNAGYEQVTGDHSFGIPGGTYVWYKTLYEDVLERKTVLATKLHAATTLGDAPPFEKFYAGGSYSIRGFKYRGVSTRGLQTNVLNPERKDPIGSDWIFLANAEVTVPLIGDNIAALFFIDSGAIDSGPYRMAVGTGIQILIPWLGTVPMRFELAAPLKRDDDDEIQAFSFSIRGKLF
ncbi:MAG: outer membrane protein assembly factor, partial [Phycisphaerae bacterium]